jgi:hypothetical protein
LGGEGGNDPDGDEDSPDDDNEIDQRKNIFLPKSVTGSPRHMRELATDALHITAELGPATDFVTLTTNVKWREIQEQLLQGQTAFDRPDIVCQVNNFLMQTEINNY